MSAVNLAQVSQASAYIPFLNLQYIYCVIVSYIGKACTNAQLGLPEPPTIDTSGVVSVATSTVQTVSSGGFWSWLWPFGHSAAHTVVEVATTTAASDAGFWAGMFHALPTFMQSGFLGVGTGLSFLWSVFSWVTLSLSALLFIAIIATVLGIIFIRMSEWTEFGVLPPKSSAKSYGWSRWQDLLNSAMSTDPKHWRDAIVAADGMLGELLTRIGYHGPTTGDQMRSIPEGAFVTLPEAWEAHRIKNFVAARSTDYILTQREAFRVMKLYEQVFEEFDFI